MATTLEIQRALLARGYRPGALDGIDGPLTREAIKQFQRANNLAADGIAGPKTLAVLFKAAPTVAPASTAINPAFDPGSAKRLAQAHPLLQKLCNVARDIIEFRVLDSQRGRDAQELAFRRGVSKAHFGQSAHNWSPAIAVDLFPAPYDWDNTAAFRSMNRTIGWYDPDNPRSFGLAKELLIPIRAGWDWNMDGSPSDGWDLPHIELHPWRDFAKQCRPYEG